MDSLGKLFDGALDALGLHRYRNGRSELDYFSRQLRPRFSLVEIDGKFYDRNTLKKKITNSGLNVSPESLQTLSAKKKSQVMNAHPYRIYGKK
jgi:hypothetical protein